MNIIENNLSAAIILSLVITFGLGERLSAAPESMPSASPENKVTAEKFEVYDGLANIYIRLNSIHNNTAADVVLNGNHIGHLNKGEYMNIRSTPGRIDVSMRKQRSDARALFARFDINVDENSIVLIDCYAATGFGTMKHITGPVLQESHSACPNKSLYNKDGVAACFFPLEDRVVKDWGRNLENVHGSCTLSSDKPKFVDSALVQAKVELITNSEYEYERAAEANTESAYSDFINAYPRSEYVNNAREMISLLQNQKANTAYLQKIKDTQQRDARLPLAIRKDKYIISLTDHLNKQEFNDALFYIELLDQLNVDLSPSFEFFWGEALLRTGQPEQAMDKLYSYVSNAGPDAQYYTQALQLASEAEKEITQ